MIFELPLYHPQSNSLPSFKEDAWNEAAELQFVLEEENRGNDAMLEQRISRLHFPRRQGLRARHVPGAIYMPAIILQW